MKGTVYAAGFALGGLLTTATAFGGIHRESFMPDNNLNLQDCLHCESTGGLTKKDFTATIAKAERIFGPIIEAQGGKLEINALWTDSTVNASATQVDTAWIVNMYGGLARRPEVSVDGFTMVLCHELGHHLAGFPFRSEWASNEGQSDYFAAHVCPKLWWGSESSKNLAAAESIPESVKTRCSETWTSSADVAICTRAALAAKSVVGLLAVLKNQEIDIESRDPSEVTTTFDGHPDAQCRLDTYVAAALCPIAWDTSVIPGKATGVGDNTAAGEEDSARYVCSQTGRYSVAQRPLCWFKPGL